MRKIFLLLAVAPLLTLLTSCESEATFLPGTIIEIDNTESNIVINEEGQNTFTFRTSDKWTVTVTDTAKTEWLKLSHLSGESGDNSIKITAVPNNTFSDRKAFITLASGNSEFTVGVFQEFGNGMTDIPIPDKSFREYCLTNFDTDKDGKLSFKEAKNVKSVNTRYSTSYNIKSLQGIEYFFGLEELICGGNYILEVDLSKNTELKYLDIKNNLLSKIDLSKNTELLSLVIDSNSLSDIDLSKNTKLIKLSCYYNKIETLDLSANTQLTELICSENNLNELDLSNNKELIYLNCRYSKLTSLNISNMPKLLQVYCNNNNLTSLDLSNCPELNSVYCNENELTALNVKDCIKLSYLDCSNNNITTLNLSNTPQLYNLDCAHNKLTSLNLSSCTRLSDLYCSSNLLTSLDLSANANIWGIYCQSNPQLKDIWLSQGRKPYIWKDDHTEVKYK